MTTRKSIITTALDLPIIQEIIKYDYFLEGTPRLRITDKITNFYFLDNNRAVYSVHNIIKIIDLQTGIVEDIFKYKNSDHVTALSTNKILIASASTSFLLKIHDLTGKCIHHLNTDFWFVQHLLFHDNYLYNDSDTKTIIKWNLTTGKQDMTYDIHNDSITNFVIIKDKLVTSGYHINILDLYTGELIHTLEEDVQDLKIVDNDRILIISATGKSRIYSVSQLKCETILHGSAIAILPDQRIVTIHNKKLIICNCEAQTQFIPEGCENICECVALLPNGNIISNDNNILREWDLNTEQLVRIIEGHIYKSKLPSGNFFKLFKQNRINYIGVSPKGELISIDTLDQMIIWE